MDVYPVTLDGQFVQLQPLTEAHWQALWDVGSDEALWKLIPNPVRTPEAMRAYVETALDAQRQGTMLPFVIVHRATNQIVGSTRYLDIDKRNHGLEIGSTWIGVAWQRTAVNTEAKYLLLQHAFETLQCIRVQLKTDVLNEQSRNAILRIGAKPEGIRRNHIITASGRIRDSIYFSIIDAEWPAVKAALIEKLNNRAR
ncbi:MAG: GNAT family N-acetyltransferase [Aggregatilineales bacterium]